MSVGAKVGFPLTSTQESGSTAGRISSQNQFFMKRYTFGPSVEVQLPLGLTFEGDALYERVRLDQFSPAGPYYGQSGLRAHVWKVPLLLKRNLPIRRLGLYAVLGSTLRKVGENQVDDLRFGPVPGSALRQQLTFPADSLRVGITAGGGVSRRLGFLRIEPEIRYTHWTSKRFLATTEQVDFLVGIRFPVGGNRD